MSRDCLPRCAHSPHTCLIRAGLPSCVLWPQHGWGYTYMYSALDNEDDLEKAKKLRASCIAGAHCMFTCMHGRVKTDTAGGHVRYTVCTEANSTYMAVPNAGNPKSLQWDVDNLRDAFGGWGTDEDKVIRVLCSREYQMLATPRCIVDTVHRRSRCLWQAPLRRSPPYPKCGRNRTAAIW